MLGREACELFDRSNVTSAACGVPVLSGSFGPSPQARFVLALLLQKLQLPSAVWTPTGAYCCGQRSCCCCCCCCIRWNPKGVAPAPESGTSHFSIVDEERNAVSITTSVSYIQCSMQLDGGDQFIMFQHC
jgi:hypothetical protein